MRSVRWPWSVWAVVYNDLPCTLPLLMCYNGGMTRNCEADIGIGKPPLRFPVSFYSSALSLRLVFLWKQGQIPNSSALDRHAWFRSNRDKQVKCQFCFAGFTLVELLVVISIIALLASVILVSLNGARTKGNEAAIKEELLQFRNLYETNATNGNYNSLQPAGTPASWALCQQYSSGNTGYVCQMTTTGQCSLVFAHDTLLNSSDALNECNAIIKNTGFLEIGVYSSINLTQHYSIVGYLPSANQYLCYGNSGANSTFTTSGGSLPSTATGEAGAGCPGNP